MRTHTDTHTVKNTFFKEVFEVMQTWVMMAETEVRKAVWGEVSLCLLILCGSTDWIPTDRLVSLSEVLLEQPCCFIS